MRKSILILMTLCVILITNGYCQQPTAIRKDNINNHPNLQESDFRIYSNPSNGQIRILFTSTRNGEGYLSTYASEGLLISRKKVVILIGTNTWKEHLPNNATRRFIIRLDMDTLVRKSIVIKNKK